MAVITICYRHDVPMDQQYYVNSHVRIVQRVWGALGLERAELRKVTAAADGSPPPYQMIASVYFPSLEALKPSSNTRRTRR